MEELNGKSNDKKIDTNSKKAIGSIYLQAVEFPMKPPQEIFGGVWEIVNKDRFWGVEIVTWKRIA